MSPRYLPKWPPFSFGGLNTSLADSRVIIIPVPYDSTASFRTGSRNGPEAIIDASRYMELFDHETGWSPCDVGIHTMRGIEPVRDSSRETLDRVKTAVGEAISDGKFPVLLGGEHTVTVGAVEASAAAREDLRVVVLDAHCDLRDEYEGSRYSHACTNRRLLELVEDVTIVGVRSCSAEEWNLIGERGLAVHLWKEGDHASAVKGLEDTLEQILRKPPSPLYLSIDMDVFNPMEVPAVGTPEPSGPVFDDLLPFIRSLAERTRMVAFDMVELSPLPGDVRSQFLAAKLLYKILSYRFRPNERRKSS